MSPLYRTPTFLMVLPSAVTSASTHGKSVPNRFFSLARFLSSFFSTFLGGGPPNPPPAAGCIASNSFAGISRWIAHTFVAPNSAVAIAGFGSSAGVARPSAAASTQPETTTAHRRAVRTYRRFIGGVLKSVRERQPAPGTGGRRSAAPPDRVETAHQNREAGIQDNSGRHATVSLLSDESRYRELAAPAARNSRPVSRVGTATAIHLVPRGGGRIRTTRLGRTQR